MTPSVSTSAPPAPRRCCSTRPSGIVAGRPASTTAASRRSRASPKPTPRSGDQRHRLDSRGPGHRPAWRPRTSTPSRCPAWCRPSSRSTRRKPAAARDLAERRPRPPRGRAAGRDTRRHRPGERSRARRSPSSRSRQPWCGCASTSPTVYAKTAHLVGSYDWVLCALGADVHVEQNWALESGLFDDRRRPGDRRPARSRSRRRPLLAPSAVPEPGSAS